MEGHNHYQNIEKNEEFTRLGKQLIMRLDRDELELLNQAFENNKMSKNYLGRFFEQEGDRILNWILFGSSNNLCFQFIFDKCPHMLFQKKFRAADFSFLRSYLKARRTAEDLGILFAEDRIVDREKFKLLIQIDPEGIEEFMEKNRESEFMKKSVLEDYDIAWKKIKR